MSFHFSNIVAIVCHDAGGAEIISSYIKQHGLVCEYALAGPALKIFKRKLGVHNVKSVECVINNSEWLLCGTGWQSDFEWKAIKLARDMGKKSVAFLDHWTNYFERFVRLGNIHFPDEIWVGDVPAEKIANEKFPNIPVKFVSNPYFAELRHELRSFSNIVNSSDLGIRILYICEPTTPLESLGYTDHEALQYFFKCIANSDEQIASVCLRPHPSEPNDKYSWAIKYGSKNVTITGHRSLLEEIVDSDWIVGRSSMALVIGLFADKKVFGCIPPGGKSFTLPYKGIMPLVHES